MCFLLPETIPAQKCSTGTKHPAVYALSVKSFSGRTPSKTPPLFEREDLGMPGAARAQEPRSNVANVTSRDASKCREAVLSQAALLHGEGERDFGAGFQSAISCPRAEPTAEARP